MPKKIAKASDTKFYAVLALLVIVIVISASLFYLLGQKASQYTQLLSNNTQISTMLSTIKAEYNVTEYNLTHPYTEVLYYQKTINLPKYNETISPFNSSYNYNTGRYSYTATDNFTWGRFNTSFNAPYPGYIVFNATSTLANSGSPSICRWEVSESNKLGWRNSTTNNVVYFNTTYTYKDRFLGNDGLFVNLTSASWTELCPIQSITYYIPVNKGENYIIIDNNNSTQGQTITFSAKYVGFHTS